MTQHFLLLQLANFFIHRLAILEFLQEMILAKSRPGTFGEIGTEPVAKQVCHMCFYHFFTIFLFYCMNRFFSQNQYGQPVVSI